MIRGVCYGEGLGVGYQWRVALPVQNELLQRFHPLVRLHFRVGHQSVAEPRAKYLECLFLVRHSLHLDNVMHVDEPLG